MTTERGVEAARDSEQLNLADSRAELPELAFPLEKVAIPDRLFFRIGDAAEIVGVKPYVLRFWETEFKVVAPQKSTSGQRVYRRADVENLLLIKHLLYRERYSIEGARRKLSALRRSGEVRDYKEKTILPPSPPVVGVGAEKLARAAELAQEIASLAQAPISRLFTF